MTLCTISPEKVAIKLYSSVHYKAIHNPDKMLWHNEFIFFLFFYLLNGKYCTCLLFLS